MHNGWNWGGWNDVGFGRWWAHLPYNHAFGANLVSDFFEQENLTFSQWLAWLRRWMWALDQRMGQLDNRLTAVEARKLTMVDSKSIKWDTKGGWSVPKMTWDPALNQMSWTFPNNELIEEADVVLSKDTEHLKLIDGTKEYDYDAQNATEIKNDGVFTPSDSVPLNYLYKRTNTLQDEIDDLSKKTGVGVGNTIAADFSFGTFSHVVSPAISTQYVKGNSGVNNVFFDASTGFYFVTAFKENHIYIFNKAGDFITRVILNVLSGHAIDNITSEFITYDDVLKGWHIEIGCSNEVAYLFDLLRDDVDEASTKKNKDVPITEYNSLETFYNVIGSENQWIKSSPFMDQKITIWNTQSGAFATTTRQNWYNSGPVDILVQTSKFIGIGAKASADMYGRIVATTGTSELELYTVSGGKMTLASTENLKNLEVATDPDTSGGRYKESYATPTRNVIAVQIFNQPKRHSNRNAEFTIAAIQEPLSPRVGNLFTTYEVLALGNLVASLKESMGNYDNIRDFGAYYDNYTDAEGFAGISFKGRYGMNGALRVQNAVDSPEKQTNLNGILIDFHKDGEIILENSEMENWGFKQRLIFHRTGDAVNSPFSRDVPVILERVVRLTVGSNGGFAGQWVVLDAQWITDNITDILNQLKGISHFVNAVYNDMKSSGGWTGDMGTGSMGTNRHLATGNINFFGGTQDGTSFIRTNNGSTENDVTAGIT